MFPCRKTGGCRQFALFVCAAGRAAKKEIGLMSEQQVFDLFVIGGGSGGVRAARMANYQDRKSVV